MTKIGKCVLCGKEEQISDEMQEPVVCDSAQCMEQAEDIGWDMLLSQYIEAKSTPQGTAFRLR